jgi:hypothetical protein
MARADLNPIFSGTGGRIGDMVLYRRNGSTFIRTYSKPKNPQTPSQQKNRNHFADAVKQWQLLSSENKNKWNKKARKKQRKGYHLFISTWLSDIYMKRIEKNTGDKKTIKENAVKTQAIKEPEPSKKKEKHTVPDT